MTDRRRRPRRCAGATLIVIFSAALWPSGPGGAQGADELYQAVAIVTGSDMRSRPTGFARCLREVLVKVSGEPRLQGDPRVSALAAHADALVASFEYEDLDAAVKHHDDQGTYDRPFALTVRFDPARIDKALADLGERPWRGERPVVVPVLTVRGFSTSYLLSAQSPAGADQRAAFADVARDFGLRVLFPTDAEMAAWHVTLGRFPSPPASPAPHRAFVAGTLEFNQDLPGWVGSWKMRWRGAEYAWSIQGVNFDEAFRDLIRGVVRVASGHGAPD